MKILPVLGIALLALQSVVCAQSPTPTPTDPIIGRWRWSGDNIVVLSANGKAQQYKPEHQMNGHWAYVPPSGPANDVERRYVVNWEGGLWIDTLLLSNDGEHLHGTNQKKWKIHAHRAVESVSGTR